MINSRWKVLFIAAVLCFSGSIFVNAQTPTIITGAPPLDRNLNYIINESFEEPHLEMGTTFGGFLPGVDGDGYYYLSLTSTVSQGQMLVPKAVPDGWTTLGGGISTYARWGNNYNAFPDFNVGVAGQAWSSSDIDGDRSIYMGNHTPVSISEEPTFLPDGEVTFPAPPIIVLSTNCPPDPDCYGPDPFAISQTITGLIPGRLYRMSFFASGEWASETWQTGDFPTAATDGIMGVQVEGYDLLYVTIPAGFATDPMGNPHVFGTDDYHVYTLEFAANDTEMDISFLNWGHFGETDATAGWTRGRATEVVIDDVIINIVNVILDVTIQGAGDGRVDSTNPGITCSSTGDNDCDQTYDLGTMVTLTATPGPASYFVGWSGDDACTGDPTNPVLNLTMDMDISCIAEFELLEFVLNPIFPALDDNINFISAENAYPGGNVAFVWGKKPGQFKLGGNICNGATFGINNPKLLAIERANEFGVATCIFYIPLFSEFEFSIQLQALDIQTCRTSNQIDQIIRKEEGG